MKVLPTLILFFILSVWASFAAAQMVPVSPAEPEAEDPAEVMAGLRQMALTSDPEELGVGQQLVEGRTYGAIMEMPVGDQYTATVVAFADGSASLYTTSNFGVIGGIEHEPVRRAAISFVKVANHFIEQAEPVTEFPRPGPNQVFIYILTVDGVYAIRDSISNFKQRTSPFVPLFAAGHQVLVRLHAANQELENTKQSADQPVDKPAE